MDFVVRQHPTWGEKTNPCEVIYVTGLGHTHYRVDQEIGVCILARSYSELSVKMCKSGLPCRAKILLLPV